MDSAPGNSDPKKGTLEDLYAIRRHFQNLPMPMITKARRDAPDNGEGSKPKRHRPLDENETSTPSTEPQDPQGGSTLDPIQYMEHVKCKLDGPQSLSPAELDFVAQYPQWFTALKPERIMALSESRALQLILNEILLHNQATQSQYERMDQYLKHAGELQELLNASSLVERLRARQEADLAEAGIPIVSKENSPLSGLVSLTDFDKGFRSSTREISQAAPERQHKYSGEAGNGIHAPHPNRPPSEDPSEHPTDVDVNERDVLIRQTNRLPTIAEFPEDLKIERVVAAYRGKKMSDNEDRTIEIDLDGSYYTQIWRENSEGDRETYRPMRAIRAFTRCCSMMKRKSGEPLLDERLQTSVSDPGRRLSSAIVGISARTFELVVMQAKAGMSMKFGDDIRGFDFKTEPSQKQAGIETIFQEAYLVPGNLSQLKRLIGQGDHRFQEEQDPVGKVLRQNQRAIQHLPPQPLQNRKVTSEDPGRPNMQSFYTKGGKDTHWTYWAIPLGLFQVPAELVSEIQTFLLHHRTDPMSINTAIRAAALHIEIKESVDFQREAGFRSNYHVPGVNMAVFIIYYPHWIRFHEIYSMTRYAHPFRFISQAYETDTQNNSAFQVDKSKLNEEKIRLLFKTMTPRAAGITTDWKLPLLPASMPGTTMTWPKGVSIGEPPHKDLFALCLLDDIRTLGLPSYHPRPHETQVIAIPDLFARGSVRTEPLQRHYVSRIPPSSFWKPFNKGLLVAQTSDTMAVGPVFKGLEGKSHSEILPVAAEAIDKSWLEHVQPHSLEHMVSEAGRVIIAQRNQARQDLMIKLNKSVEDLIWDPAGFVWKWEGMNSEVVRAVADKTLPEMRIVEVIGNGNVDVNVDVTMNDSPPQPEFEENDQLGPEPAEIERLSPEAVRYMRDRIRNLPCRAVDWDSLLEILEAEAPMKEDVASVIRAIKSELTDELTDAIKVFEKDPSQAPSEIRARLMFRAPTNLARMLGVLAPWDEGEIDLRAEWKNLEGKFPAQYKDSWNDIDCMWPILHKEELWKPVSTKLQLIYYSDACLTQARLITELEAGIKALGESNHQTIGPAQ